jgi:hypothetical protein
MLKVKIPNPRDIVTPEAVEEIRKDFGVVPGERVVSFRTFMSLFPESGEMPGNVEIAEVREVYPTMLNPGSCWGFTKVMQG